MRGIQNTEFRIQEFGRSGWLASLGHKVKLIYANEHGNFVLVVPLTCGAKF
jgi:hypothetical protein